MHEHSYYKWNFFFKKEPLIVIDLKEACDILLPPDVFITHWGKLAKGLAWYCCLSALPESTLKFEFGRQCNPTRSASAERHKSINKRSRVLNATLWLLDSFSQPQYFFGAAKNSKMLKLKENESIH